MSAAIAGLSVIPAQAGIHLTADGTLPEGTWSLRSVRGRVFAELWILAFRRDDEAGAEGDGIVRMVNEI
jgi:hypothetical protein